MQPCREEELRHNGNFLHFFCYVLTFRPFLEVSVRLSTFMPITTERQKVQSDEKVTKKTDENRPFLGYIYQSFLPPSGTPFCRIHPSRSLKTASRLSTSISSGSHNVDKPGGHYCDEQGGARQSDAGRTEKRWAE